MLLDDVFFVLQNQRTFVRKLLFEYLTVKLVKLSSRRCRDLLGNWCCLGVVALSRSAFSSLCVHCSRLSFALLPCRIGSLMGRAPVLCVPLPVLCTMWNNMVAFSMMMTSTTKTIGNNLIGKKMTGKVMIGRKKIGKKKIGKKNLGKIGKKDRVVGPTRAAELLPGAKRNPQIKN